MSKSLETSGRSFPGVALREMREKSGKTLKSVAGACGRTISYWSRVEKGQVAQPNRDAIQCATEFFGGSIEELYETTPDPQSNPISHDISTIKTGMLTIYEELILIRRELSQLRNADPSPVVCETPRSRWHPDEI